jgi:cell division protein FtsL
MSEKKVVKGTIALTLGLLCVALVGSLLGTLWYYTSMVNEKNNIIATRDSQISQQSSQISQLNLQITGLQSQLADFNNIVSLTKSET